MSKKKSKKKTSLGSKLKANSRVIGIIVVFALASGISYYIGMSSPRSYIVPINLTGFNIALEQWINVQYAPAHTGVRISFEVATNSDDWTLTIYPWTGASVDQLSSSVAGLFTTDSWIYSPDGIRIFIRTSRIFAGDMELTGILTITSSRFPFI